MKIPASDLTKVAIKGKGLLVIKTTESSLNENIIRRMDEEEEEKTLALVSVVLFDIKSMRKAISKSIIIKVV